MASPVKRAYLAQVAWQPVKSSNVAAVGYQPDFGYLWVKFKSGAVYLYEDVPPGVYEGFLAAPSKGQYLYYVVRNKGADDRYPYDPIVK